METVFYVGLLMIVRLLVPFSVLILIGTLLTKERTKIY